MRAPGKSRRVALVNLTTHYLGLTLSHPIIVGSGPFCDSAHIALQLQDAGAAALVMRSLFEEQIAAPATRPWLAPHPAKPVKGGGVLPEYSEYQLSPDQYLRQIEQLKKVLSIPVIASLNGSQPGNWTDYARLCEAAGADALELNFYRLVTTPLGGEEIEAEMLETVARVVKGIRIPVAVKLSPFHTSLVHFALELRNSGAAGVVLFNRFYQPDFNLEDLEVQPLLRLSDPTELLLRLRWIAILAPQLDASISASGGVHNAEDVVKALLAGADTVQLVSVLLRNGPRSLTALLDGLKSWLAEHGYESLDQVRGAMDLKRCPDPTAFERASYIRILHSWRV